MAADAVMHLKLEISLGTFASKKISL